MGRKDVNTKQTNYVLRIVCEGDKTEPWFFTELCRDYLNNGEVDAKTIPQPKIPENEINKAAPAKRGRRERPVRKTNNTPIPDEVVYGQPPLKWVQKARVCISEGADEAWAVYDKDNHPKHKEALEEAEKVIDGKKINIAFTSRSFEYYLLLHFEYIYRCFEKTECCSNLPKNEGRNCCGRGIPEFAELDCRGTVCINGYARTKKYWEESKKDVSTYDKVKDHLIKGIVNACRLREESNMHDSSAIYERNPYTNADMLVGRIIGYEAVLFGTEHRNNKVSVCLNDDGLHIRNISAVNFILLPDIFKYYNWESNKSAAFITKRIILQPEEERVIKYNISQNQLIIWRLAANKNILLLPRF